MSIRRLQFNLSEKAGEQLDKILKMGGFTTVADAIRTSLAVQGAILEEEAKGYDEIILRNTKNGKERVIIRPKLG